jgi:hypothetical protein
VRSQNFAQQIPCSGTFGHFFFGQMLGFKLKKIGEINQYNIMIFLEDERNSKSQPIFKPVRKLTVPLKFYFRRTSPESKGFPIAYLNGETYTTSEIWISHFPNLSGIDTGDALVPYSFMVQLKKERIDKSTNDQENPMK